MFWLYYNTGSCNYGDHDVGMEKHLDRASAEARAKELYLKHGRDVDITLVEGSEVPLPFYPGETVLCHKPPDGTHIYAADPVMRRDDWLHMDVNVIKAARSRLRALDATFMEAASRKVCEDIERLVLEQGMPAAFTIGDGNVYAVGGDPFNPQPITIPHEPKPQHSTRVYGMINYPYRAPICAQTQQHDFGGTERCLTCKRTGAEICAQPEPAMIIPGEPVNVVVVDDSEADMTPFIKDAERMVSNLKVVLTEEQSKRFLECSVKDGDDDVQPMIVQGPK